MVSYKAAILVLAIVLAVWGQDNSCTESMDDAESYAKVAFSHISDGKTLDILVNSLQ